MGKLRKIMRLSWLKFAYYNFLCPMVERERGAYVFPYRGARIELARTARIRLCASLRLNENKYLGSRAECYLRLRDGARMAVTGGVALMYNGTIEVHRNASLEIGSCSVQSGAVIICAYRMSLGQGCLFSRMCYVSDSDHHRVLSAEGEVTNRPRETVIGDHVWVGVKATVMKGAKIKAGSVIGANALVGGHVGEHKFMMGEPSRAFSDIYWSTEGFDVKND